ncbi:MAG: hypothetical protein ABIO02_00395 [Patescibacteria group bacterium]
MNDTKSSDPLLNKVYHKLRWTRENTIGLFESAEVNNILSFYSKSDYQKKHTFQSVLFQFQCIITTTNTFNRKLKGDYNAVFGVLVENDREIPKKNIPPSRIYDLLVMQLDELQIVIKDMTGEEGIDSILGILNHEYLHQGELILMFREAGVELPERFQKAFAL